MKYFEFFFALFFQVFVKKTPPDKLLLTSTFIVYGDCAFGMTLPFLNFNITKF